MSSALAAAAKSIPATEAARARRFNAYINPPRWQKVSDLVRTESVRRITYRFLEAEIALQPSLRIHLSTHSGPLSWLAHRQKLTVLPRVLACTTAISPAQLRWCYVRLISRGTR